MFSMTLASSCISLKFVALIVSIYWRALQVYFGKMPTVENNVKVSYDPVEISL